MGIIFALGLVSSRINVLARYCSLAWEICHWFSLAVMNKVNTIVSCCQTHTSLITGPSLGSTEANWITSGPSAFCSRLMTLKPGSSGAKFWAIKVARYWFNSSSEYTSFASLNKTLYPAWSPGSTKTTPLSCSKNCQFSVMRQTLAALQNLINWDSMAFLNEKEISQNANWMDQSGISNSQT